MAPARAKKPVHFNAKRTKIAKSESLRDVKRRNEEALNNKFRSHWKKIFIESCVELGITIPKFKHVFPPKSLLRDNLLTKVIDHVWENKLLKNGKKIRKNTMRTFRGTYLGAALISRGLSWEKLPEATRT